MIRLLRRWLRRLTKRPRYPVRPLSMGGWEYTRRACGVEYLPWSEADGHCKQVAVERLALVSPNGRYVWTSPRRQPNPQIACPN